MNEWLIFFYLSQTVKLSLTAAFEVFSSQNSSSSGKFLDGKKRGIMVPRRLFEMAFVLDIQLSKVTTSCDWDTFRRTWESFLYKLKRNLE